MINEFISIKTISDEIIHIRKSDIVRFLTSEKEEYGVIIKNPDNSTETWRIKADPIEIIKHCQL